MDLTANIIAHGAQDQGRRTQVARQWSAAIRGVVPTIVISPERPSGFPVIRLAEKSLLTLPAPRISLPVRPDEVSDSGMHEVQQSRK